MFKSLAIFVIIAVVVTKLLEKYGPVSGIDQQKSFFKNYKADKVSPEDFRQLANLSNEDLERISAAKEIIYSAQYVGHRGSYYRNSIIFSPEPGSSFFLKVWESANPSNKNKEQLFELMAHNKRWFYEYAKHRQVVFKERLFRLDNELTLYDPSEGRFSRALSFKQLSEEINKQGDPTLRSQINASRVLEVVLTVGSSPVVELILSDEKVIYRSMDGDGLADTLKKATGRAPLSEKVFQRHELIRASVVDAGFGKSKLYLSTFETSPIDVFTVADQLAVDFSHAINQWIDRD